MGVVVVVGCAQVVGYSCGCHHLGECVLSFSLALKRDVKEVWKNRKEKEEGGS